MQMRNIHTFIIKELSPENPIVIYHNAHQKTKHIYYDMHYGLELGIVLTGRMQRVYNDYKFTASRGDVWFCGMWEPHGYKTITQKCEVLVLVILPTLLDSIRFVEFPSFGLTKIFHTAPAFRPRPSRKLKPKILNLAGELIKIHTNREKYQKLWLRLKTIELILTLHTDWPDQITAEPTPPLVYTKITPAIELVMSSNTFISVSQAARVCRMSRNTFSKLFASMMGIPFPEFALRYRLSSAANDLLQSNDPIKTIAYRWGFVDESHFSHRFKKYYNLSPTEYRKLYE